LTKLRLPVVIASVFVLSPSMPSKGNIMEIANEFASRPFWIWVGLMSILTLVHLYSLSWYGKFAHVVMFANLAYCMVNEPAHVFFDIVFLSAVVLAVIRYLGVDVRIDTMIMQRSFLPETKGIILIAIGVAGIIFHSLFFWATHPNISL
jgi:hypothetical protein